MKKLNKKQGIMPFIRHMHISYSYFHGSHWK